jgi:hypothetical protein
MPVMDPLGLRRCALCSNAFTTEEHREATEHLRERGVIGPDDFVCRACIARIEREYGPLPYTRTSA